MEKIAIIGAGIAGIVCAKELVKTGVDVTIFDKSRGVSGRSTTKRWPNDIAIDMGIPYFKKSDCNQSIQFIIDDLIENNIITQWAVNQVENSYVGIPKMSSIARHLANNINLISKEKITEIKYDNSHWEIKSEHEVKFGGFKTLIFAIPAPQLELVKGIPNKILNISKNIKYNAVNTLLIELDQRLWGSSKDEFKLNNSIIEKIIADYKKPDRNKKRFTYTVHSNEAWATQSFDTLNKEEVITKMETSLKQHFELKNLQIKEQLLHQWRYSQPINTLTEDQNNEINNNKLPIYFCGDWCNHGTFTGAIESGLNLAHNITP